MKRWEYLFLTYNWMEQETDIHAVPGRKYTQTKEEFYALCNRYGNEGWELVGYGVHGAFRELIFKRAKVGS